MSSLQNSALKRRSCKRNPVAIYAPVVVQSRISKWLVLSAQWLVVRDYTIHLLYIGKRGILEYIGSGVVSRGLLKNYVVARKFGDWQLLAAVYCGRVRGCAGSKCCWLICLERAQGHCRTSIQTRGNPDNRLIMCID